MDLIESISERISQATNTSFIAVNQQSIGGGCINTAFRLEGQNESYFVKTNRAGLLPMFEAEAAGLTAMAASQSIKVPEPVCYGEADGQSYLVLEYIEFGGRSNEALLGEQLAGMHRYTNSRYGFDINNTIGSTSQFNEYDEDWVSFYQEKRLTFQLKLAMRNGCGSHFIDQGMRLVEQVPVFFKTYTPVASILHGDLWGGNYSYTKDGTPIIFDPATYYGDREADVAMTELFGGFGPGFYDAYNNAWALDEGYPVRKVLYKLYHVLNHFNLFGGGYLSQAQGMLDRLLAEV